MDKRLIKNIFLFMLGCLSCFLLHHFTAVNNVVASAFVGLVFSVIFRNNQSVIYAGSFAGMSSISFIKSIWLLIPISIIGGVIFLKSQKMAIGLGGKLGTIAFISVSFTFLVRWLF